MDPLDAQRIAPDVLKLPARQTTAPLPQAQLCFRIAFAAAIVSGIVCLSAVLSGHGSGGVGRWSAGALFVFSSVAILSCLGHRLPPQNLCAVLLVSWASASLGLTLALKSHVFLDAVTYADGFGPRMLGIVPWQLPFLWLALVLSSRETARLILRPYRRDPHYGYWLIGLAALLVLGVDLVLQPFAVRVAGWWRFETSPAASSWLGVPWVVFPTNVVLTLLVLLFVSPWLIAKRAIPTARNLCPLMVWLLLNLCLLIGSTVAGLWLAMAASLAGMAAAVFFTRRARAAFPAMPDEAARI
ncbi:MAG TPA: carotenoid biosynthesis protein [Verrucomicrobiota bacterium]|nr:carotenoid biosynthesis protein [Verrucomicrobiota bacterium]HRZ56705.1 carotenoid biosynthesis protein [Candidatus Paceibacterota bacterium]